MSTLGSRILAVAGLGALRDRLHGARARGLTPSARVRDLEFESGSLGLASRLRLRMARYRSGPKRIDAAAGPRHVAPVSTRAGQDTFGYFVQSVADYAIFTLDLDGTISSWNVGAERIKGYSAAEIVGRPVSLLYPPEDRAAGEPQKALDFARRFGRFETEGWRLRRDGTRFWAHLVLHLVRDEAGRPVGFAKVTRDVTERNAARRALNEAREALFQAQKLESLGQLVSGIAYDFNNLMSAVSGNLQLAIERLPDHPSVTPLLVNARAGAQRGMAVTGRMLSFARRQQIDVRPVDLGTLVRDMDGVMRHAMRVCISLDIHVPADLGWVLADANQLELALLNLVINARDAMPEGGAVTITADEQVVGPEQAGRLLPGRYLRLAVSDTGIGMDEATLTRAVEPFYTTKGPGLGTGLGLSMVHGMAEQSGGVLVLRSRKGEGTTAEVWLRWAPPGQVSGDSAPACGSASVEGAVGAILVVDDDELALLTTITLLSTLGYVVFQASSAEEALRIVRREGRLNLVLTDQAMPQMSGLDLASILSRERPSLPVAVMSGLQERDADRESGSPWLAKPFTPATLRRFVAGAIRSG